jgi:chloramphenicol 3-O phosphotransferase
MALGGLGQIVLLNGAPRSGKSSIVAAIQDSFPGVWLNLGVDVHNAGIIAPKHSPGIGLRPGEPDHPVAPLVPLLYAGLFEAIAAEARLGLNVVSDLGMYDREQLQDAARRLEGLPVLRVGVHCPIEVIMERRNRPQPGRERTYQVGTPGDPVPEPVRRWQEAVHALGGYDLEVDTSVLSPRECAGAIRARLEAGPGTALAELAR